MHKGKRKGKVDLRAKCDRQDFHPDPDLKIRTGVNAAFPPLPRRA